MREMVQGQSSEREDSAQDEKTEAATPVDDWEIEEILSRYDQVSERGGTRSGGTTACH
ncbi:MAG: hypothetical protein ACRDYX_16395 [Egibacteraceae bacterium]